MKKGFTLAEVLITITILGIVAAIILPALKNDIDKQAWVGGLKADINIVSNVFSQILAEEDVDDLRDTSFWATYTLGSKASDNQPAVPATSNSEIKEYFSKYFKLDKPITTGFPENYTLYNLDGTQVNAGPVNWTSGKRFYLANSSTLHIVFDTVSYPLEVSSKVFSKRMANILFDVNGDKYPNTLGKDVHAFMLAPNGSIYAYGSDAVNLYNSSFPKWDTKEGCQGKHPSNGYYCTQRIIDEGYKISYN